MEQLSFSNKPDEKVFFLESLAGLGRAAAGKAAARTSRKIRTSRTTGHTVLRPNNPIKN